MKIMVNIGHPAQVHLFKNFVREMKKRGHEILIVASDKDVAYALLDSYGLSYIKLSSSGSSVSRKLLSMILTDIRMYAAAKKFKPDLFLAHGSICFPQVAMVMRKPVINFADDEDPYVYYKYLVSAVCGFSGFKISGEKIVKIDGYKELAYLHPNWYRIGHRGPGLKNLPPDDNFVLLRFVAWNAYHDINQSGFDLEAKRKLVRELEKYTAVFITSESELPEEFRKYLIRGNPSEIHDLLSRARLLICDSQTMATEAGVLGIPVVRCNTFVGADDDGNFIQLEQKYGLIFNYRDTDDAIRKAIEILKDPGVKGEWKRKRERLLSDTIDVTAFMIWFVENYPASFREMKEHPDIQYQFRNPASWGNGD